jgi:hypothetical protein
MLGVALGVVAAFILGVRVGIALGYRGARREIRALRARR